MEKSKNKELLLPFLSSIKEFMFLSSLHQSAETFVLILQFFEMSDE